jgi:glycosyltransferase involved in cell wall biosynthesis
MDISIVIPIYNEEGSLRELSAWILKVMIKERYDYEVIMIDDGSTDLSRRVMDEISRKNPRFRTISFQRNYGKSAALQVGFQMARGNVVITMDADLQDSPDEIPELFKMIRSQGYDMVSGWKKKRHDPFHKRFPSKFYNFTVRMASGIKLHDFNCGLKAYRNDVVKSIEVYGEMHRYIPVIAKRAGFKKIGEKVIKHYPRKFGKSKFGIERYAKGYLDLLTISFISRYGRQPMHIFGLLGTLIFLGGFFIAGYLAYDKWINQAYFMTTRPLFYFGLLAMILGTILFVGGFLGELICRNSPDRNRYLIRSDIERFENKSGNKRKQ